jgi:hypothetical protein
MWPTEDTPGFLLIAICVIVACVTWPWLYVLVGLALVWFAIWSRSL